MGSANLGVCAKILRAIFIIIQVVFVVLGAILIALGVVLIVKHQDYEYLTGSEYLSGAAVLVAAGALSVLIAGLGILGACTLSYIFLSLYTIAVVIVVCLEIAAGLSGFIFRDDVEDKVNDRALEAIRDYRPEHNPEHNSSTGYKEEVNDAVDFIQKEFDCCGWNSTDDWLNSQYFNITQQFPSSCGCNQGQDQCSNFTTTSQFIWSRTCEDRVTDFLKQNQLIVGVVGIVFGVFEILAVVMALGLCCAVKASKGQYTTV